MRHLVTVMHDYISFVEFRSVSGFVAEEDRRGDVLEGKYDTWVDAFVYGFIKLTHRALFCQGFSVKEAGQLERKMLSNRKRRRSCMFVLSIRLEVGKESLCRRM